MCWIMDGAQGLYWYGAPRRPPSCHRPRADQRTRTVAADEPRLLPPIKARRGVGWGALSRWWWWWRSALPLFISPVKLRWPGTAAAHCHIALLRESGMAMECGEMATCKCRWIGLTPPVVGEQ